MRFAIIGAGISGLTCAYELKKAGHDVIVYEKNDQVGGRMASRVKDNFIFDIGADHLCAWYSEMKKYCAEFGIEWEKMRFLEYAIVKDKKIVAADNATSLFAKLRLAAQYFLTPQVAEDFFDLSNFAEYDDENGYDFMRRRLGKKAADYLVDSFCTTYQFHRATEISKGALFGILHSLRVQNGRWYLHRTKGGMQALPDAFAKSLAVQLNQSVTSVEAQENGKVLVNEKELFDAVVMATTATVTRKLYKNPSSAQAAILDQARYAASISLAFRVPKKLLGSQAVIWVPYIESEKISGYVNETMKGEEVIQGEDALLSAWLHEDYARSIMHKTDEEIFALAKAALLEVCPWFNSVDQLVNHDLQRWPEAMPKFYAGYLKAIKTFLANGQGAKNVFFCGDYMNSLWTEGSLRGGKRTAERILVKG